MNCKNCGGTMQVDAENKLFICPYCNATEPIDSSSKEEIEELLKGALKDANEESQKMMRDMLAAQQREMALASASKTSARVALYVVLTVAAVFTLIMALFGLTTEYKASGVVALIQCILLLSAIILKANSQGRPDRRSISLVANWCIISAALMVLVWLFALTVSSDTSSKRNADKDEIYQRDYYWPEEGFAKTVPRWGDQPDYSYVNDREFSATILDATEEIFAQYVAKCKEEGFNVDVTEDATHFNAYDEAGNELDLDFLQNVEDDPIYLKMYKALEFDALIWPTQGILKDVPQPDSEEMMVESMATGFFKAYINDMSPEKFLAYVQQCMDAGFDGRYEKDSNSFYGTKRDGDDSVTVSIELKRNRVMLITVY